MKSSGSWSDLHSLILIGFCPVGPFSIASFVRLVFLVSFSLAFSTNSDLWLVCPSSGCNASSGVHPGVCFSRSCLVSFFGVVSGRPLCLGLMVRMGGTNNVSHYAMPVHDFFPSTRDSMASFKHSVMIATQSTFSPSYMAMTNPALYFGMDGGWGCTNPYSHSTRATSWNRRSSPPCVRYALLLREYSLKYSINISVDGFPPIEVLLHVTP